MNSKELVKKGDLEADSGNLRTALEYYKKAIDKDRKNYIAYYNKGVTHMELGQYKKAIEELSYYAIKRKDDIDGWINLAVCLINTRKFKEALSALASADEIDGDDPDVYFNKGIAYHNLDLPEDALDAFSRAVELDPQNPEYRYHMANLLADMGDYIGAEKQYLELLDVADELLPNVLYNLGNTYIDMGEKEKAIKYLKMSLDLRRDRNTIFNLAFAMEDSNPEDAEKLYRELIDDDYNFHEAHYNLACLLARLGSERAIPHLKTCLTIDQELYSRTIRSDSDLDNIRHMDEFRELLNHN